MVPFFLSNFKSSWHSFFFQRLVLGNMLNKTDMLILKRCRYFFFLIHNSNLNFYLHLFSNMNISSQGAKLLGNYLGNLTWMLWHIDTIFSVYNFIYISNHTSTGHLYDLLQQDYLSIVGGFWLGDSVLSLYFEIWSLVIHLPLLICGWDLRDKSDKQLCPE